MPRQNPRTFPSIRGFCAFRSTLCRMVRTPDGSTRREVTLTLRVTEGMRAKVEEQRRARGGMSLSAYIRWLISQDSKRIEQEKTWDGA